MGALEHSSCTRFDTKFALPGDVVAENASTVTKGRKMQASSSRETRAERQQPEGTSRAMDYVSEGLMMRERPRAVGDRVTRGRGWDTRTGGQAMWQAGSPSQLKLRSSIKNAQRHIIILLELHSFPFETSGSRATKPQSPSTPC